MSGKPPARHGEEEKKRDGQEGDEAADEDGAHGLCELLVEVDPGRGVLAGGEVGECGHDGLWACKGAIGHGRHLAHRHRLSHSLGW